MISVHRYHFDSLSSTNDYAKELIEREEFVVVTANFQTRGKGRNKNVWEGEYGKNLYYSFARRFQKLHSSEEVFYLQGLSALAVLDTLERLCPKQKFRLKYPNDIYALSLDGCFRKISGILVEHLFTGELCQASIIGIGINVHQTEFPNFGINQATSLALLGENIEIEQIIKLLTDRILEYFDTDPKEMTAKWQTRLNLIGRKIKIVGKDEEFIGKFFDSFGRLILLNPNTFDEVPIDNGDSIRYELK